MYRTEELHAPGLIDGLMDELMAMLQAAIRQASDDAAIDATVVQHLKLASSALELEQARRSASVFRPGHVTLNVQQLARARSLLSQAACEADAVAKAAQACGMSPGYFERCFRNATGTSPRRHILEARMDKARHLLLNTDATILDVAGRCGYAEQCHFTRVFSRETGMSPGAWRRLFHTSALRVTPGRT